MTGPDWFRTIGGYTKPRPRRWGWAIAEKVEHLPCMSKVPGRTWWELRLVTVDSPELHRPKV